jgi:hypothetical protein
MQRFADQSYRDAILSAMGLPGWTEEDEANPDRPETVLKRQVLRFKLPMHAVTEACAEFHTHLRATIGTSTQVTDVVECDFFAMPAMVIRATPVVTRGTFASTLSPTIDDVDVEIVFDRGKNGTLTGREKNATSSTINAIPLTALADVLTNFRVEAKQTLGVRFRSRYASTNSSGISEAIIAGVTLHWNFAP